MDSLPTQDEWHRQLLPGLSEIHHWIWRIDNEFWLDNENLHQITSGRRHELRVDLEDFEGETRYAHY